MYKIIIKGTTREQVKDRVYRVTGEDSEGNNEYGYVESESTQDVEREVYTQFVENLDMTEVIKAVNGMNNV